jgi:hypothetical protein
LLGSPISTITKMIVYVLHDLRRPNSEWLQCALELERQGITGYTLFPAQTNGQTVEESINISHKSIVALAKFHRLPEICILESDVLFPAVDGWQYFLRDMPETFDLYLGGVYSNSMDKFRTASLFGHHHTVATVTGMHCYIIRARFYDTFLGVRDDMHIDQALDGKGLYLVCYPFAAIQRKGWSANHKADDIDYNTSLIPQDIYYNPPFQPDK